MKSRRFRKFQKFQHLRNQVLEFGHTANSKTSPQTFAILEFRNSTTWFPKVLDLASVSISNFFAFPKYVPKLSPSLARIQAWLIVLGCFVLELVLLVLFMLFEYS